MVANLLHLAPYRLGMEPGIECTFVNDKEELQTRALFAYS